jgi:hypothetical protein
VPKARILEAVREGIIVNEYTFTEAGRRFG